MNKMNKVMIGLCILLLLAVSVPSSLAYFFTYARTNGGTDVTLKYKSTIDEEVEGTVKKLTITAAENADPMMIRARAFYGSDVTVTVPDAFKDTWKQKSDDSVWYYYIDPIDGKEESIDISDKALLNFDVQINVEDPKDFETRHVVVVYEAAPAIYKYDDQGNGYWDADWEAVISTDEG